MVPTASNIILRPIERPMQSHILTVNKIIQKQEVGIYSQEKLLKRP
jgi:hypothetical protein